MICLAISVLGIRPRVSPTSGNLPGTSRACLTGGDWSEPMGKHRFSANPLPNKVSTEISLRGNVLATHTHSKWKQPGHGLKPAT